MDIIVRQGYKYLIIFGVLFLLSIIFNTFECLFFTLFVITAFLFRNPKRDLGSNDKYAILSPIDGKIKSISKISYFETDYIRIVISKSILGVGVLRAPCDMKLIELKRRHGLFLCNAMKSSNSLNERALLVCKNGINKFAIRTVAGAMSRNLHIDTFEDCKVGDKMGFMSDGQVFLMLPVDAHISVTVGDKVKATSGVIGFFNYEIRDDRK